MENTVNEVWVDIPGYDGDYQVSNIGRVKSLKKKERILKPTINRDGYLVLGLCKNGINKGYTLAQLVAQSFVSNPKKLSRVSHLSGDKLDNRASNLVWREMPPVNIILANESKTILKGKPRGSEITSNFLGVSKAKDSQGWFARLSVDTYRARYLGRFKSEMEAALAYDYALIELGYNPVNF
ncbi:NUMOD4 domain-containing protein [uncultured Pontibacter sp.]|uniref:NUMOD4 domain-containing protein n=1 Tax=uncultured Pontibacter sp. TaxID=453356 RepID=UPI00262D266C|nr:NUMOD4 domain-containing protein [uncultured Pontibacter sp.]